MIIEVFSWAFNFKHNVRKDLLDKCYSKIPKGINSIHCKVFSKLSNTKLTRLDICINVTNMFKKSYSCISICFVLNIRLQNIRTMYTLSKIKVTKIIIYSAPYLHKNSFGNLFFNISIRMKRYFKLKEQFICTVRGFRKLLL